MRPAARIAAAGSLPLVVPGLVTLALWALPGSPVSILCPPGTCTGQAHLAAKFHLHQGPWHFYSHWMGNALTGDFGRSWTLMAGSPVIDEMATSLPWTTLLVAVALVPLVIGTVLSAVGRMPRSLDVVWQAIGVVPAVILALLVAAWVTVTWGMTFGDWRPDLAKLVLGGLVLGVSDGVLAGAVLGTRAAFEEEGKQRYAQIAVLRGEPVLANALPNVLPALVGQLRGRILHILSTAVIVEVVVGIPGLGQLLWDGTLAQDFGVVLAATFAFSVLSGALMFAQALAEILLTLWVRRSPAGVLVFA